MKKSTLIITIILAFIIIAVVVIIISKRKKAAVTEPGTSDAGEISTDTPTQDLMPLSYAKRSGYNNADENALVKALQKALNDNFNAGLTVDGKFGPLTEGALTANGYPAVIYWKQWGEITGKPIWTASGKLLWNKWLKIYIPWALS